MTELVVDVLESPIFWKAVAAVVAAIWSLPAVQWFRRQVREHNMGILLDTARDVCTPVYRKYRSAMLNEGRRPDEAYREAKEKLKERLKEKGPRAAGKLAEDQLERLIDEAFDELDLRKAQKAS